MKKILTISLIAFFLVGLSCRAQEDPTKPQRWDVGVDALSLFDKNNYPAYSIFLARKLGESGFALRSRVGIEGSSFENLTTVPFTLPYPRPNNNQKIGFFTSLGIQKNLWQNFRSNFYTGVDIGYGLNQEFSQTLESVDNFNELYFERKITLTNYVLSQFLGYSHSLNKNITLRIEMAANLIIKEVKVRGNGWYIPRYDQSEPFFPPIHETISANEYGDSRSFNYKLNPLNQIILSYNF